MTFVAIMIMTEYGPVKLPFVGFCLNHYSLRFKQELKTRGVSLHGRITAIQNLLS